MGVWRLMVFVGFVIRLIEAIHRVGCVVSIYITFNRFFQLLYFKVFFVGYLAYD